jgi:hypothetical protein
MNRATILIALAACGDNRTVAGTEYASGSRLELVTYALSDGTTAIDHHVFHDRERDEDCTILRFSSGSRFCAPTTAGGTAYFTESTCTRVVGAERSDRPPPAYFVRPYILHGETLPSRLYRVGEPTAAPALVWRQEDNYCLGPYPIDPAYTFYTVGDGVTTDDLVAIRETDHVDAGRLTFAFDTSDDGWRAPGAITDDDLGVPCTLTPSPNAATATCIPDLPATSYFADTACSDPLVTDDRALHHDLASGCTTVVEWGEPFTGAVFERIGEACIPVAAPADPLYRAGATHELATLDRTPDTGNRVLPIALGDIVHDELLHDTTLDADCSITGGVCAPVSTVDVRPYFTDPACITPIDVAFVPTGSCEPPARFAGGRAIGDVYPGAIYELTTGDRCDTYVPPPRFAVHVVGDAPADLVTAARKRARKRKRKRGRS